MLDERVEVVNTTRNILFKGTPPLGMPGRGLHVMFMGAGDINIDGLEVVNGGRRGELGRYPIHWHHAGNRPNDFIRNSSIHDTFNRCITIHGTNQLRIENNICLNTVGHAIFLEDGNETGNQFIDNAVMQVKHITDGTGLLYSDTQPSDFKFSSSAAFWISNPDNIFIGNSASSAGTGYWYALKNSEHMPQSMNGEVPPSAATIGVFSNNSAHTVNIAYSMDGGPNHECAGNAKNPCINASGYKFGEDGYTSDSASDRSGDHINIVTANDGYFPEQNKLVLVDGFTAYKASGFGLWLVSGNGGIVTNSVLADSGTNVALVFSDNLTNSLVVGASSALKDTDLSDNVDDCGALSSSFSKNPGSYVLYDGPSLLDGVHFAGYSRNCSNGVIPFSVAQSAALRAPSHQVHDVSFEDMVNIPVIMNVEHDQGHPEKSNYSVGFYEAVSNSTIVPDDPIPSDYLCDTFSQIQHGVICDGKFGLFYVNRDLGFQTPLLITKEAKLAPFASAVSAPNLFRSETVGLESSDHNTVSDALVTWKINGFVANDTVRFQSIPDSLPAGNLPIVAGKSYYVIPVDDNHFKLSNTMLQVPIQINPLDIIHVKGIDAWYANQFSFSLNRLNTSDDGLDDDFSYRVTFLNPYLYATRKFFGSEALFMEQNQWSPWITYEIPKVFNGSPVIPAKVCNIQPTETYRASGTDADLNYRVVSEGTNNVLQFRLKATRPINEFVSTRKNHGGYFESPTREYYFNQVGIVCGNDTDGDGIENGGDTYPSQTTQQDITIQSVPPLSAAYNGSFQVSAFASSGLSVDISATGGCSINGGLVTMTSSVEPCQLSYSAAENETYFAAPTLNTTTTATKAPQTISKGISLPFGTAAYGQLFPVGQSTPASSTSGLPVTITTGGGCTGTGVGSASITMTSGTINCTVYYSQAGNANYLAAPTLTSTTTATKASQTISKGISLAYATAAYGQLFPVGQSTPASSTSGLPVTITTGGGCTGTGVGSASITMTSGTINCTVYYSQAGNANYLAAPTLTSVTIASQ